MLAPRLCPPCRPVRSLTGAPAEPKKKTETTNNSLKAAGAVLHSPMTGTVSTTGNCPERQQQSPSH